MSKKKGKSAARKAPNKASAAKRAKASRRSTESTATAYTAPGRTSQVTVFIFRTSQGNKIRTAPQLAFAGPGHVEWTVVNLVDGTDVPVTITWPDGGPWGKEPLTVRGCQREPADGVTPGRYKYVVSALDAQEDPEVEFPEM